MTDFERVPKILGSDVELGNFIEGVDAPSGSGAVAARLLLSAVDGVPAGNGNRSRTSSVWQAPSFQDWGRKFLASNGGCVYIDLDHLELAAPETLSAFDHVAYSQAMLRLARRAVHDVNARMPEGYRVRAIANCSDGHGHSYGAHLSVLLTRQAWDVIVTRKPHYMACLAAFQVSSIIFTGAGKVGSENGRPWTEYQLSQRADFLETFMGEQTTYNRPIINARDEPLCGSGLTGRSSHEREPALARLHVIFFDNTLCQVASLLRAGTMQIIIAMLEAGHVPAHLALDDPMEALYAWSRDPSLRARARLVTGEAVTAVELQQRFVEHASECTAVFAGVVPRASEILALWTETLEKLRERDFESLGRRIDWVLKYRLLAHAMTSRPSLSWSSDGLRHLDQIYASLDETEGLFWASEQAGLVEAVVNEDQIARALDEPPGDTRAWTRAALLRRAGSLHVEHIDWDRMAIRLDARRHWDGPAIVPLSCPYGSTKSENESLFADSDSLEKIVGELGGLRDSPAAFTPSHWTSVERNP